MLGSDNILTSDLKQVEKISLLFIYQLIYSAHVLGKSLTFPGVWEKVPLISILRKIAYVPPKRLGCFDELHERKTNIENQ